MKIGIIVYSQTGNTLSVARKLQEKLSEAGHSATVEQIKTVGAEQSNPREIKFEALPDISQYDALVFSGQVQAFSLSPAMKSYLSQVPSLQGKRAACLVTQHLPYPWLGGNRAISQMKKICESKGGEICETGIVNWSNKKRENMITDVVEKLSQIF